MLDVLWAVVSYERLVVDWELDPKDAIRGITWVIGLVEDAVRGGPASRCLRGLTRTRPGQQLAVVVGAGGMAMAVARRLGDSYRVLLADRDEGHLERAVAALQTEGHDATGVVCDVVDADR